MSEDGDGSRKLLKIIYAKVVEDCRVEGANSETSRRLFSGSLLKDFDAEVSKESNLLLAPALLIQLTLSSWPITMLP